MSTSIDCEKCGATVKILLEHQHECVPVGDGMKHLDDCPRYKSSDWRDKYWPCGEPNNCDTAMYEALSAENTRLREALEFTLIAAETLYRPDRRLVKGHAPDFYHTLSYEGDLEMIEKTKKARAALERKE